MYRANHIASECYLARWADENGQVCVVEPPVIESSRRKPAKVAARRNFWGTDPEVRREAEETINRIETDAAVALRGLAKNWPLPPGSRDFLAIAFLIAVHLWRNPPGHDRFHSLQQRELERNLTEYTRGWNEAQIREFLTRISSDRFRAELMLADLFPAASLLGSMHWSLIEFDVPLLATRDQPVTVVPTMPHGAVVPLRPLPAIPLLDAQEIRIAVGPHHALVLTWLDEPADAGPLFGLPDSVAAQINRTTIAQTDRQWFHQPARRPTTLSPPVLPTGSGTPVARQVVPAYDASSITHSRRRQETARNVNRIIEEDDRGRRDGRPSSPPGSMRPDGPDDAARCTVSRRF